MRGESAHSLLELPSHILLPPCSCLLPFSSCILGVLCALLGTRLWLSGLHLQLFVRSSFAFPRQALWLTVGAKSFKGIAISPSHIQEGESSWHSAKDFPFCQPLYIRTQALAICLRPCPQGLIILSGPWMDSFPLWSHKSATGPNCISVDKILSHCWAILTLC